MPCWRSLPAAGWRAHASQEARCWTASQPHRAEHMACVACLVNCHAVTVVHLVELVNAHHTAVCQHHGPRLQSPLACTRPARKPYAEHGHRAKRGPCNHVALQRTSCRQHLAGRWDGRRRRRPSSRPCAASSGSPPVSASVVTAAVRPTPEEPRPVVDTQRGAMFITARSSCDLATPGSPTCAPGGGRRGCQGVEL